MTMNYFSPHQKHHEGHSGFTLLETLFAILIFSAALVSLLAISSKGIRATYQVNNETTALYLAQEGLEVVRNIRDSNFNLTSAPVGTTPISQSGVPWDGLIDQCVDTPCEVTYQGPLPSVAPCSTCEVLKDNSGFYVNGSGTSTGFRRMIRLVPQGNDQDEYLVTSQVTWNAQGTQREVELQTLLKKWQ